MSGTDDGLQSAVRRAWAKQDQGERPAFDASWRAAEERLNASRRRYRLVAGAAVVAAAVFAGFNLQAPPAESYIELADLMDSTYWSAPSDVLLPEREFDIYQELPVLFEST